MQYADMRSSVQLALSKLVTVDNSPLRVSWARETTRGGSKPPVRVVWDVYSLHQSSRRFPSSRCLSIPLPIPLHSFAFLAPLFFHQEDLHLEKVLVAVQQLRPRRIQPYIKARSELASAYRRWIFLFLVSGK